MVTLGCHSIIILYGYEVGVCVVIKRKKREKEKEEDLTIHEKLKFGHCLCLVK